MSDQPSRENNESADLDGRRSGERLLAQLDELEEPLRTAAMLYWRHGLETREIAELMNWEPTDLRRLLRSALDQLHRRLFRSPPDSRGLGAVRERVLRRAAELGYRPVKRGPENPAQGRPPYLGSSDTSTV